MFHYIDDILSLHNSTPSDYVDLILHAKRLLNQGFLVIKLNSPHQKVYGRHGDFHVPFFVVTVPFLHDLRRREPPVEHDLLTVLENLSTNPTPSPDLLAFVLFPLSIYIFSCFLLRVVMSAVIIEDKLCSIRHLHPFVL